MIMIHSMSLPYRWPQICFQSSHCTKRPFCWCWWYRHAKKYRYVHTSEDVWIQNGFSSGNKCICQRNRSVITTFLSNDQPKLVICSRNVMGGQRNYRRSSCWNIHSLSLSRSIRDWNQQNAEIDWTFFGNNSKIFFCCTIPLLINRKLWKDA